MKEIHLAKGFVRPRNKELAPRCAGCQSSKGIMMDKKLKYLINVNDASKGMDKNGLWGISVIIQEVLRQGEGAKGSKIGIG